MKTAYCVLGNSCCGVIKFTDEILVRLEELKKVVTTSFQSLRNDVPWRERFTAEVMYGGMKWETDEEGVQRIKVSACGPVLVYAHNDYPDHRCVDDYVSLKVFPSFIFVDSPHEEGEENPLGFYYDEEGATVDHTVESIPEVFFSEHFVRKWCEKLNKLHLSFPGGVFDVVKDMPQEHQVLLDEAVKKYLSDPIHSKALMRRKEIERQVLQESMDGLVRQAIWKLANSEKLRLGLDFHGVISDDPQYFSLLSQRVLNNGGEVHVITGSENNEALKQELEGLGIKYTHLFSIVTHHLDIGTPVATDEHGLWMDEDVWNRTKGEYCLQHGIHLHFDDSEVYGKYFDPSTMYVKYPELITSEESHRS